MLTLKTSVAAAILRPAIAGTAGVTYVATRPACSVAVSCPAPAVAATAANVVRDCHSGPVAPTESGEEVVMRRRVHLDRRG